LAAPAAVLLAWVGARRADELAPWRRIVDPELLPALRRLGYVEDGRGGVAAWLLGAAALLCTLALAGPATRNADAPAFRNLDVIMVLLDLSPSVTRSGGLDDAQAAVSRLLDAHGTRPVALAVFAGESYLVSVPTVETESLQTAIGVVGPEIMPDAGSRPDRALALARTTLKDAASERADVVLVSDGGGLGPEALHEARLLRGQGVRVSGVFVAPQTPPYGAPAPDRATLAALAEAGDGLAVDATQPDDLIDSLARETGGAGRAKRVALLFTDHGRWIMAVACLSLLPLFRRGGAA
jgi:Ca-activated chloride channel family protein